MPTERKSKAQCCPPAGSKDPGHNDEALAAFAWAIAHPIRLRILDLLQARDACVCGELVEELPVAQSTVSQHLKIMKEAGLIHGEVDGPKVCYCINQEALTRFKEMVRNL